MWPAIAMAAGGLLAGLSNKGPKAPTYTMSPEYKNLIYGTVYPTISDIIKNGGLSYNTAGMQRSAAEDIANQYGGAYRKVNSMLPYGNTGSMNRANLSLATSEAGDIAKAYRDITTQAEQAKRSSLLSTLNMGAGMQDPNLAQFGANMQTYGGDARRAESIASLYGSLAGLGGAYFMGQPAGAPATAGYSYVPHTSLADYANNLNQPGQLGYQFR